MVIRVTASLLLYRCSAPPPKCFIITTPHLATVTQSPLAGRRSIITMASPQRATEFLKFIDASPTPFHAVESAKKLLQPAGFTELKERDSWASKVKPGGKYFVTRNASTLVAFAVGQKWKPGNPIAMIGAHTDSPCLRIKPISKRQGEGFLQVGVEKYGGGLWHTWFDRDLSVAGRVFARSSNGEIVQKLVKVERPILRIPTLAIHLNRQANFEPNLETHMFPIAGLVAAELERQGKLQKGAEEGKPDDKDNADDLSSSFESLTVRHHSYIVDLLAQEANVASDEIVDFEILLYDTQKAALGGLNNELIFAARQDNLNCTYTCTKALIESVSKPSALDNESVIRLICLFDHEEIGSQSAQGAGSNMLPAVIRRLSIIPQSTDSHSDDSYEQVSVDASSAYEQTLVTSFLIAADMAHSIHPNYAANHESAHKPEMNKGPVIKINANVRYATNAPGVILLQEAAKLAKAVPLQFFVVRNDSGCGSTIGPIVSSQLGVRTLDLGSAQLSMHSIRETAGTHDLEHAIRLFESFFDNYSTLESKILVD